MGTRTRKNKTTGLFALFGIGFYLYHTINWDFMKQENEIKRPKAKLAKPGTETIRERVRRHLSDKNSVITDDDIRNVKTELYVTNETPSEYRDISKEHI